MTVQLPDTQGWTLDMREAYRAKCVQIFDTLLPEYEQAFIKAINEQNVDLADNVWNDLCEAFLMRLCNVDPSDQKDAPPRGRPLPYWVKQLHLTLLLHSFPHHHAYEAPMLQDLRAACLVLSCPRGHW